MNRLQPTAWSSDCTQSTFVSCVSESELDILLQKYNNEPVGFLSGGFVIGYEFCDR
jgi:hypothetical protein